MAENPLDRLLVLMRAHLATAATGTASAESARVLEELRWPGAVALAAPPPSAAPKPLARSWCKRRRTCHGGRPSPTSAT